MGVHGGSIGRCEDLDGCQLSSVDGWTVVPVEETEAQRGKAPCPRAHSKQVADPAFELTPV